MDPLYIGLLFTLSGIWVLWGWVVHVHRSNPKTKREQFKEELDKYIENMRKFDIDEEIIDGHIKNFDDVSVIRKKNKQLTKALKKHQLL